MNWRLRCDALHLRRLISMEPTGAVTAVEPRQHPVIRFAADGSWLVEPSATQLQAKCKELGLI